MTMLLPHPPTPQENVKIAHSVGPRAPFKHEGMTAIQEGSLCGGDCRIRRLHLLFLFSLDGFF